MMLIIGGLTGIAGVWISRKLHYGYVQALERNLLNQSIHIQISDIRDSTTRAAVMQTLSKPARVLKPDEPSTPAQAQERSVDPVLRRIANLRSTDAGVVRDALRQPLDAALAGHVIPLMAWNAVSDDAVHALQQIVGAITGQLVDALLDPAQEFAIRRRIPRVLSATDSQRAFNGLAQALFDRRFEVRFQSGRALAQIQDRVPSVAVDQSLIIRAILQELSVDKEVWDARSVIDGADDEFSGVSSEHVFRLLSLILPRDPLKIAYRGLHSRDEHVKGMALEYLESVLPDEVRKMISPALQVA
jgi:hypothetical protein